MIVFHLFVQCNSLEWRNCWYALYLQYSHKEREFHCLVEGNFTCKLIMSLLGVFFLRVFNANKYVRAHTHTVYAEMCSKHWCLLCICSFLKDLNWVSSDINHMFTIPSGPYSPVIFFAAKPMETLDRCRHWPLELRREPLLLAVFYLLLWSRLDLRYGEPYVCHLNVFHICCFCGNLCNLLQPLLSI